MKKMRGDMETEDKVKKIVYSEKVDQETKKEKKLVTELMILKRKKETKDKRHIENSGSNPLCHT